MNLSLKILDPPHKNGLNRICRPRLKQESFERKLPRRLLPRLPRRMDSFPQLFLNATSRPHRARPVRKGGILDLRVQHSSLSNSRMESLLVQTSILPSPMLQPHLLLPLRRRPQMEPLTICSLPPQFDEPRTLTPILNPPCPLERPSASRKGSRSYLPPLSTCSRKKEVDQSPKLSLRFPLSTEDRCSRMDTIRSSILTL